MDQVTIDRQPYRLHHPSLYFDLDDRYIDLQIHQQVVALLFQVVHQVSRVHKMVHKHHTDRQSFHKIVGLLRYHSSR